jgi:hypothetical protein
LDYIAFRREQFDNLLAEESFQALGSSIRRR